MDVVGDQKNRALSSLVQPLAQCLRRILTGRAGYAHDDVIIQRSLDSVTLSGQQECVERAHAGGTRQGHQLVYRVELALKLVGFFVQYHNSPL